MNDELKKYYNSAKNVYKIPDLFIQGFIDEMKKAIIMMGDEVEKLEKERDELKAEIVILRKCQDKMAALEQHGVDNWEWYGDAMASLGDDE